jgi:hypothetical protein
MIALVGSDQDRHVFRTSLDLQYTGYIKRSAAAAAAAHDDQNFANLAQLATRGSEEDDSDRDLIFLCSRSWVVLPAFAQDSQERQYSDSMREDMGSPSLSSDRTFSIGIRRSSAMQ